MMKSNCVRSTCLTYEYVQDMLDRQQRTCVFRSDRFVDFLFKRVYAGGCDLVYACPDTGDTLVHRSKESWQTVHRISDFLVGVVRTKCQVYNEYLQ